MAGSVENAEDGRDKDNEVLTAMVFSRVLVTKMAGSVFEKLEFV